MAQDDDEPADHLRVRFDENMSPRVAKALKLLGKDVDRAPACKPGRKATPDDKVAAGARRANRLIFTNNFDMVVAATQQNTRIIWFYDRNHNSPTMFNQARLFFRKWETWEALLAAPSVYCIRVSMDRTTTIAPETAHKQAARLDRLQKATRQRVQVHREQQRLEFAD